MSGICRAQGAIICCSVLQAEVTFLCETHWPDRKLIFLPSMMHMHPELLASSLESVLEDELKQGYPVVLVFGDCCMQMTTLETLPGVARTRGKNSYELLLGPGEYRRLSHEGAFFLMPEWVQRWKEIFTRELGLTRNTARSLMRDMHRTLMYLDAGLVPVPVKELHACADYCGLPCDVLRIPLTHLSSVIEKALIECRNKGVQG